MFYCPDQNHDPKSIIYHNRDDDKQKPAQAPVLKRSEQGPPRKRTKPSRTPPEAKLAFEETWRDKVVVSNVPSHTAQALCESNGSAGPSFVNLEHGYFCDMQTKTVYPVCKEQSGNNACYDPDQRKLGRFPSLRFFALCLLKEDRTPLVYFLLSFSSCRICPSSLTGLIGL